MKYGCLLRVIAIPMVLVFVLFLVTLLSKIIVSWTG